MPPKEVKLPKEPRYLTGDDVFMRLDGGLVKYLGEPYMAHSNGKKVNLTSLLTKGFVETVDANSTLLDISAIEIGYVNHKHTVLYVTRMPIRKQKQTTSYCNTIYYKLGESSGRPFAYDAFFSQGVYDAIKGNYKSFKEVIGVLAESPGAIAISNRFALQKTEKEASTRVYFENSLIGDVNADGDVMLQPEYNDSVVVMALASLGIGVH